jgi:hypothetical protein
LGDLDIGLESAFAIETKRNLLRRQRHRCAAEVIDLLAKPATAVSQKRSIKCFVPMADLLSARRRDPRP